jgi:transcriptional regulator with XRE-family HTH domain
VKADFKKSAFFVDPQEVYFSLHKLIFFCTFVKMSEMQKEKLRTIRKKRGYTQQEIADLLATDVSNYSRKESGNVKIIRAEWEKIANFLDVPIEDIYEEDEAMIVIENQVFNDSPGSSVNSNISGDNISHFTNDLGIEIIKNLQDYISLLKEEMNTLKKKNGQGL